MSQPFDRHCELSAAGTLDRQAGQFWVSKPWQIVEQSHNLSAYERNAVYLNLGEGRLTDVTFLSGADSDGDARAAIAADFDSDGMLDLAVRQAGGGPVLLFRNRAPKRHWLRVALSGTESNRAGVGARLIAHVGERKIVREMFPHNAFVSQQPCEAYFGLGDSSAVDRLEIHWPSGREQTLTDLAADRRITIEEPQ